MLELDGATFEEAIGEGPLLVDFWAPWCRPCLALEPILAQLEDRVPVGRLNIDEHPDVSTRYGVLSIPTVILFAGGEPRGTLIGVRPLSHFEEWLGGLLPGVAAG